MSLTVEQTHDRPSHSANAICSSNFTETAQPKAIAMNHTQITFSYDARPHACFRSQRGDAWIGYGGCSFVINDRTDVHALIDELTTVARAMAAAGK